ncbi:MAG: phosphatase PAP2 family protein [Acidimicrobiia bacterium]
MSESSGPRGIDLTDEMLIPDPQQRMIADATDGTRRRRRPTGAPPALPRSIGTSGKLWLVLLVALVAWIPFALASTAVLRFADRADTAFLQQVARLRTGWLTTVMTRIDRIGSGWTLTVLAVGTIILLLGFRRWRHLLTLLASITVLEIVGSILYDGFSRPRPYGVTIIGRWSGFSMPSPPVAVLSLILMSIAYTLVVPGKPRTVAKWIVAALVALFVSSRLYLAVDHPSDVVVAVTFAVAIPLLAYRFFTPNEVFPVAYGRGKTAHLDVGGRRGLAIRAAVHDQLGLEVAEVGHVGLAGSGGSTPIRMRLAGDPPTYLFAKLYAMNHVRSDRWYKLGRTILYGRLEDESSFQTVRRLAEYEDYAARLMLDNGIPTARSYGIVELTPEREYLLVTEFFDNAQEIGDAEVDDQIIDEALMIVRRLWDAGLAHRDIKPANLLVREGHVFVIDTAFAQVRPSPWREAVDLANMMLVLAVRTDAPRVYARALQFFTEDDIAEAFAAARGVASPSQLRAVLKADGRSLIEEFRALAPPRRTIALQRWSVRRVALALALVIGVVFAVTQTASMLKPAHDVEVSAAPDCGTGNLMILMAQSVPRATAIPCLATLPAGWKPGDVHVQRGRASFTLDSDQAGTDAVEVVFRPRARCSVDGAQEVPSDEAGTLRFERPEQVRPELIGTRTYLFPGGCVVYRYSFDRGASSALLFAADQALAFQDRASLVDAVRDDTDLRLCGAGVRCPGGPGPDGSGSDT